MTILAFPRSFLGIVKRCDRKTRPEAGFTTPSIISSTWGSIEDTLYDEGGRRRGWGQRKELANQQAEGERDGQEPTQHRTKENE